MIAAVEPPSVAIDEKPPHKVLIGQMREGATRNYTFTLDSKQKTEGKKRQMNERRRAISSYLVIRVCREWRLSIASIHPTNQQFWEDRAEHTTIQDHAQK